MTNIFIILTILFAIVTSTSSLLLSTLSKTSTSTSTSILHRRYNGYNKYQEVNNGNRYHSVSSLKMARGTHGQNFKFLPTIRGSEDQHFPRIMRIAGIYPELTADDLLAPPSIPSGGMGCWSYDFPDPDGPQLGIVAIPGSPKVTDAIDPTVMITTNAHLGIPLQMDTEMLVVVDRGDLKLTRDSFYVFRNPNNDLTIEWTDRVEEGYEVLGKVILCTIPYSSENSAKKTGFMEEDDG